ncbi:MAG: DUF5615 family PIN-like protein [Planctomycetaceae bacterium]
MNASCSRCRLNLLFDQNLSFRLVTELASLYPGSEHVRNVGLATADDETVWNFAAANGFVIVTKGRMGSTRELRDRPCR